MVGLLDRAWRSLELRSQETPAVAKWQTHRAYDAALLDADLAGQTKVLQNLPQVGFGVAGLSRIKHH